MHLLRGELRKAYDLAEQLLGRAQRMSDRSTLPRAESALGATSFYMGELLLVRKHVEIAISIYEPERHRRRASQVGHCGRIQFKFRTNSGHGVIWRGAGARDALLDRFEQTDYKSSSIHRTEHRRHLGRRQSERHASNRQTQEYDLCRA